MKGDERGDDDGHPFFKLGRPEDGEALPSTSGEDANHMAFASTDKLK